MHCVSKLDSKYKCQKDHHYKQGDEDGHGSLHLAVRFERFVGVDDANADDAYYEPNEASEGRQSEMPGVQFLFRITRGTPLVYFVVTDLLRETHICPSSPT